MHEDQRKKKINSSIGGLQVSKEDFRLFWIYGRCKVAAKKLYLLFKILCMDQVRHGKFKVFEIFNFFGMEDSKSSGS